MSEQSKINTIQVRKLAILRQAIEVVNNTSQGVQNKNKQQQKDITDENLNQTQSLSCQSQKIQGNLEQNQSKNVKSKDIKKAVIRTKKGAKICKVASLKLKKQVAKQVKPKSSPSQEDTDIETEESTYLSVGECGANEGYEVLTTLESLKVLMVDTIMKVYHHYSVSNTTLFFALAGVNRYLNTVLKSIGQMKPSSGVIISSNIDTFRLKALIIFNLASKYTDRIAYQIVDLVQKADIEESKLPSKENLRFLEFEVLKALDFNISGGQKNLHDVLGNSFNQIEETLSYCQLELRQRIKDQSIQLGLYFLKFGEVANDFTVEEIGSSCLFMAHKMFEQNINQGTTNISNQVLFGKILYFNGVQNIEKVMRCSRSLANILLMVNQNQ